MSYPPPPSGAPQPYGYPTQPPAPSGPVRLRGRTPRRLGWIFLVVGVALLVAGGIVAATTSLSKVNDFQRVSVATGSATINLNGTGKWIIYYETSQVSNSISELPGIRVVQLTDPSGQPVSARPYGNRSDGQVDKFTYDYNGHKGIAAIQFTAPTSGAYKIQVEAVGSLPADADVAIGRDISGGAIVGGLLVLGGVLFVVAAIVLLIVGFVKRRRHKRELQAPAYYQAPAPYGPPAGSPYGPPPGSPYGPPTGANPPPPNWGPPNS